jgi:hypothetical protein
MTDKREPEPKSERSTDDLELPENVAEDVKGGTNVPIKYDTEPIVVKQK